MRRADRLFQLVQLVRGRRLSTAAYLAERLEVSLRTVYRDVAALQAQGVPIEGEAGVGYRMGRGFDLPPLMFTATEAMALVAATRLAQQWLDPGWALAAGDALARVMASLPADLASQVQTMTLVMPPARLEAAVAQTLQRLREAAQDRCKVRLTYRDAAELRSQRVIRPLGCFYWGSVWTVGAWCERRAAFRSFRVDRIEALDVLGERFVDTPGQTLADFLRAVGANTAAEGTQGAPSGVVPRPCRPAPAQG